jgi:hypothetical protein
VPPPFQLRILSLAGVAAILMIVSAGAAVTAQEQMPGHDMSQHEHAAGGTVQPVEGSGTAWLPASAPMEGVHTPLGDWTLMLHGQAFVQYVLETGEEHHRGREAGSINWFMAMAGRSVGAGHLQLRGMASLEPWTLRRCGYPNLLATGELCRGDNIHDRQHPHDLVMEAAATYDHPLRGDARWFVYGGPAGEPALGPVAFQHRPSSSWNPIAPITHHWLDSSHIAYGVVTTGVRHPRWAIEASAFNGREPDETRTDFDFDRLDSFAGRVSIAPTPDVVMQVSGGELREAEQGVGTQPRIDVARATASVIVNHPVGGDRRVAATVAWGVNSENAIIPGARLHERTHALLVETSVLAPAQVWFGRVEVVGKPAEDLHVHEYPTEIFTVGKIEAGYVRHVWQRAGARVSVGGSLMASLVPALLAPRYDGRVAPGFSLFLSISPAAAATDGSHAGH